MGQYKYCRWQYGNKIRRRGQTTRASKVAAQEMRMGILSSVPPQSRSLPTMVPASEPLCKLPAHVLSRVCKTYLPQYSSRHPTRLQLGTQLTQPPCWPNKPPKTRLRMHSEQRLVVDCTLSVFHRFSNFTSLPDCACINGYFQEGQQPLITVKAVLGLSSLGSVPELCTLWTSLLPLHRHISKPNRPLIDNPQLISMPITN